MVMLTGLETVLLLTLGIFFSVDFGKEPLLSTSYGRGISKLNPKQKISILPCVEVVLGNG